MLATAHLSTRLKNMWTYKAYQDMPKEALDGDQEQSLEHLWADLDLPRAR